MGIGDGLRDAIDRATAEAERLGSLDTPEGCAATLRAIDLRLQHARDALDAGDDAVAGDGARTALGMLDVLEDAASALPGLQALQLDAHQILGTLHLRVGDRDAAVDALRRAASHVLVAQPDERSLAVAAPLLDRQLTGLWRELAPSPSASRIHASVRAVRTVIGHLEGLIALETRDLHRTDPAYRTEVRGPFFEAAAALVERPLPPGADAASTLARARAAVDALGEEDGADASLASVTARVDLADALDRTGRRTGSVTLVAELATPLAALAPEAPADVVPLCHRACVVALHGLRSDVAVPIARTAVDAALRHRDAGGDDADAVEGTARLALALALAEHDDDSAAHVESEAAHRLLQRAVAEVAPTAVRIAATYAAAHLAFFREIAGDAAGSVDALSDALGLADALAREVPDEPGVRAVVLEVAMANARRRRRSEHGELSHLQTAIDLLEVAHAQDPTDHTVVLDLFNATRFLGLAAAQHDADVQRAARRRSTELLEGLFDADPDGLSTLFHRSEVADEEAFYAFSEGRDTAFRWRAQDCLKLRDQEIRSAPTVPAARSRKARTALQFARIAAGMRDRRFARRLIDEGIDAAQEQIELQPDVRTAHENLVKRLHEAVGITEATGDRKRVQPLLDRALDAARALAALEPDDAELRYGLIDVLTATVAIVGDGRLKGVDTVIDELQRTVDEVETLDPLHPRRPRIRFDVHEAAMRQALERGETDAAVRHTLRALEHAVGGVRIRHHHREADDGHDHGGGQGDVRTAVLAAALATLSGEATDLTDAERTHIDRTLARLQRSGIGPGPTADGAPAPTPGTDAAPTDTIPEVAAPSPAADVDRSATWMHAVAPAAAGTRTYLKPSNGGHPRLHFGVGLAATEDLVVVGAPGDPSAEHHVLVDGDAADRSASRRGAVHIHRRTPDGWRHEAYIKPPVPRHGLTFGWAVAVDGDTVAIGAPNAAFADPEDGLPGERPLPIGAVWTVRSIDGRWLLEDLLIPDDEVPTLNLGRQVALKDDTMFVVGVELESGHGVVHEFVRTGVEWEWRSAIRSPRRTDVVGSMEFGASLAYDGEVLVVGEPRYGGPIRSHTPHCPAHDGLLAGAAWVFRRDHAGDWRPEAMLLGPSPRSGSGHGMRVAVRGDLIAVTSPLHPQHADEDPAGHAKAGAVVLYGRTATGWEGLATLPAPDPHEQEMGYSVAITPDGDVLVGSPLDAHGTDWTSAPDVSAGRGPRYGAVHLARDTADGWRFVAHVVAAEPSAGDEFGSRLALSGRDWVVAAPNDSTSGSGVGAVLHDADARESGAVHVIDVSDVVGRD